MTALFNYQKNKAKKGILASKAKKPDLSSTMSSPIEKIFNLQKTTGNKAVHRLYAAGGIQSKLKIGQPGDLFEKEAELASNRVTGMPEHELRYQPKEEEKKKHGEGIFQPKDHHDQTPEVALHLESSIGETKGGSKPLSESTRAFMEQRFGQDFSQVRLHTDKQATEAAAAVKAKTFTAGEDVFFGTGQYSPQTEEGRRLIAHELTHVVQQRMSGSKRISRLPDDVGEVKTQHFDLAKWFDKFEKAVTFTLSRFYIGRDEVWVKQVEDIKDLDDKTHPAHYNPNDRTIYFSVSGFRFIYNDRVIAKKEWTDDRYCDFAVETAAHEAFHAYQDTPRFRSKEFADFEKDVDKKLLSEFGKLIRSGVIDTYEEFKTLGVPHFTKKYLPESEIKKFMGENLPGFYRDPDWQLTAREEILNQWLKILEDRYLRARSIESALRKGITGKGLKEEKEHKISLIEKQAEKFAKMKKTELKIWLLTRELEGEKDPSKSAELEKKIKNLKKETDLKNIPDLEKRIESLKAEFMKLDPNNKEEFSRIEKIVKEWMELEERLDALIGLRSGIESVFREKGLLISK